MKGILNPNARNLERLFVKYNIEESKSFEKRKIYRIVGKKVTINGLPRVEIYGYFDGDEYREIFSSFPEN